MLQRQPSSWQPQPVSNKAPSHGKRQATRKSQESVAIGSHHWPFLVPLIALATTHNTGIMRWSLSLPDKIDELADEISALERKVSEAATAQKRERCMSMDLTALVVDAEEDMLLRSSLEDDEHRILPSRSEIEPSRRSFLPTFDTDEEEEAVGLNWSDRSVSVADMPVDPVQPDKWTTKTTTDQQALQAAAMVEELLAVLGSSSDCLSTSPTSVMMPPGSQHRMEPPPGTTTPGYRTSSEPTLMGNSSPVTPPRNVLYGQESTDLASSPPRTFVRLSPEHRHHSMPLRVPSKPSLKRVSSIGTRCSSSGSLKRNVSFSKMEIREYSIALSDHPSCSYGPPIQLGWDYRDREAVDVEEYETTRSPRRSMHQLLLSYNVRRYLLLKRAGYSKSELQSAMQEVDRVKRERLVTDLFLPASKLDETLEDLVMGVRGMFAKQR